MMFQSKLLFVACFLLYLEYNVGGAEIFVNPLLIAEVAQAEHKFLQFLLEDPVILKSYLGSNDLSDLGRKYTTLDENNVVANPLHVFSLFYRLTITLTKVRKDIISTGNTALIQATSSLLNNSYISKVTHEDLVGAAFALIRIQRTYEFEPHDMAMGQLGDRRTHARLSADELFQIVKIIYYGSKRSRVGLGKEYALAITWLEASIRLYRMDENLEKLGKVEYLLGEIQNKHDRNFLPPVNPEIPYSVQPNEEFFVEKFNGNRSLSWKEMRLKEKTYIAQLPNLIPHWVRDFFPVCRGEKPAWNKEPENPNTKKCFMHSFFHPFLIIQPVKIEVLHKDPTLVQMHDVIPLPWIEKLKNDSLTYMGHATVSSPKGGDIIFDRTQSNAWVPESGNRILERLTHYFNAITGLKVASTLPLWDSHDSENYQVGVYAPGGVFIPHFDSFAIGSSKLKNDQGNFVGNRIATLMLYLSNVDGGGTAFTAIGKVAYPRKGSSVFWFNLLSNENGDEATLHGACPPIYGIKWVTNKWIRSYAHILKRKCGLSDGERLKLFKRH